MKAPKFEASNLVEVQYEEKPELSSGSDNCLKYFVTFLVILAIISVTILFYIIPEDIDSLDEPIYKNISTNSTVFLIKSYTNRFRKLRRRQKYFSPISIEKNEKGKLMASKLPPVPLDRVSFMISSSPKSTKTCIEYLKIWATDFGSRMVKNLGTKPHYTVYWCLKDKKPEDSPPPYEIKIINVTNYHIKWCYMLIDHVTTAPPETDWFIMIDDDTLPFLDRLSMRLANYPNPRTTEYFIHSPGERLSTIRLGNGGSGFILSRKFAERIAPKLRACNDNIKDKSIRNGDIRFDMCARQMGNYPIFDYGMFQMDPKGFRGDLTGFVEGYIKKMDFFIFHHLEKKKFAIFPKKFMKTLKYNQARHFSKAARISGDIFIDKYAMKNPYGGIYLLNVGYSFLLFPELNYTELDEYMNYVEQTFEITPNLLYDELRVLLTPANQRIKRFYLKDIVEDPYNPNSHWQDFSAVEKAEETAVRVYVDAKQKISITFINNDLIYNN